MLSPSVLIASRFVRRSGQLRSRLAFEPHVTDASFDGDVLKSDVPRASGHLGGLVLAVQNDGAHR